MADAFLVAVPIAVIASFRKMKKLVQDNSLIETALRTSSQLVSLSSTHILTFMYPWEFQAKDSAI